MKFRKTDQIENVRRYAVNQYGLFYLTNDVVIPRFPDLNLKEMGFDRNARIYLLDDFLLVQDSKGRSVVFDIPANGIIYKHVDLNATGYNFRNLIISTDRKLLCRTIGYPNSDLCIFDVDKNTFEKIDTNWNISVNKGQLLMLSNPERTAVCRIDLAGTELWKHNITSTYWEESVEKPDTLSTVIGVHDELLWLGNYGGELYALNVETGEVKYSSMEAGFASRYVIDQSTDQMLGLSRQYMQKLNLSSGLYEYESTLAEEIFKEYECKPDYFNRRFPVIDSHIIFCDRWKSVIGSLDYENMRIDWTHDLFATRDYAMISDLECCDGKIYVLDNVQSGNSLHVFEKVK